MVRYKGWTVNEWKKQPMSKQLSKGFRKPEELTIETTLKMYKKIWL